MAKFHHNIYPIIVGRFTFALDFLNEFYQERISRNLVHIGDARNLRDLRFLINTLPNNCTYMVLNSSEFSVWVLPNDLSNLAIKFLIDTGHIDLNRVSRDVGFYNLRKTLDDLPYNYHYIVQRYYD